MRNPTVRQWVGTINGKAVSAVWDTASDGHQKGLVWIDGKLYPFTIPAVYPETDGQCIARVVGLIG